MSDRAGWEEAAARMDCSEAALKGQVQDLGAEVGPPWQADHKLACAAALVVLSER